MVLRFSRGRVGSRLFKVRLKGLTFFCLYMYRRVYRHGIWVSDLKEKRVTYPPKSPFLGLLVKIVHKIGAFFVYWSKLVHK